MERPALALQAGHAAHSGRRRAPRRRRIPRQARHGAGGGPRARPDGTLPRRPHAHPGRDGERLRIDLRIVDRQLDLERPEIRPPNLLRHLGRVAHRAAPGVGPQIVAEAAGFDDERVAFPVSDRIAVPRRIHVLRERPAVDEDLPVHRVHFVEQHQQLRRVHGLREMRQGPHPRHRVGEAPHVWIVTAVVTSK